MTRKIILTTLLITLAAVAASAQSRPVSAKEVNGTFKTTDGANIIKVYSVGRGGLDNPGYNLQVEFYASLVLGPKGEPRATPVHFPDLPRSTAIPRLLRRPGWNPKTAL
ncbi:MAG: hypothetical protein IPP63_11660 [Chloracidobacterium sp.]|nr:hypothetical protein [Chloracidobacterium sp.]